MPFLNGQSASGGPPERPVENLAVSDSGSGYVDLSWDEAPAGGEGSGIVVVAMPSGGAPVTQRLSSSALGTRFSGLLDGSSHTFFAYRAGPSGRSEPSQVVAATPGNNLPLT